MDEAELDARSARRLMAEVVRKQLAAGISVGNNGEQQREAFFLYVQRRMSGFGGGWTLRRLMADITRYPGYAASVGVDDTGSAAVVSKIAVGCRKRWARCDISTAR